MNHRLILASGSPRRREFLERLGYDVEVLPPDISEEINEQQTAKENAICLAQQKAAAIAAQFPHRVVLAADTVVAFEQTQLGHVKELRCFSPVLDGVALGKPRDREELEEMLSLLSGRTHLVHTAFVVNGADFYHDEVVSTAVTFMQLSDAVVQLLKHTEEGMDKAGGYALQGLSGSFVTNISGSYTGVIGLPVPEVLAVLSQQQGLARRE